jgi:general secretion pathway protein G
MNLMKTRAAALPRRDARTGFSLAELMVVIVILGLLATLVLPNVMQRLSQAFGGKVKADVMAIHNALTEYAVSNDGLFPDSLDVLVEPDDNGYTILQGTRIPLDPWKNEYLYEPPGGGEVRPRVYSLGKDGAVGGEGDDADVDNWSIIDGR